jgi:hypothetical protein
MRRIFLIGFGILALLAVALMVSVWHAAREPVNRIPGPLEVARASLHRQLEDAKKTESQAEASAWNSSPRLRALIDGHQQRMDQLKDNKEAADIVAYDRDAVDRLEKRIAQIAEEQAAKAEAAKHASETSQQ